MATTPISALADDTLIGDKLTQQITSLSPREQARREAAGAFPASIKLGTGPNGRKVRVLGEVREWVRQQIEARDPKLSPAERHHRASSAPNQPTAA